MKVYIAGPLFSEAEKRFNSEITDFIEDMGFDTFLPQRDGYELAEEENMDSAAEKIFNYDIAQIDDSDVVVFNMDGRVPDEGACVEVGYACGKNKECIGLKTDTRTLIDSRDSHKILGPLKGRVAADLEELGEYLTDLKNKNDNQDG